MKIEATVHDICALLELAGVPTGIGRPAPKARHVARATLERRVPGRLLERYEWLVGMGRAPAVVAIVRGACSGCHLRLPAIVELRTHRAPAIHTCPHCQRMLYVPELLLRGAGEADPSPKDAEQPVGVGRS